MVKPLFWDTLGVLSIDRLKAAIDALVGGQQCPLGSDDYENRDWEQLLCCRAVVVVVAAANRIQRRKDWANETTVSRSKSFPIGGSP